jgi:hypothetical protein
MCATGYVSFSITQILIAAFKSYNLRSSNRATRLRVWELAHHFPCDLINIIAVVMNHAGRIIVVYRITVSAFSAPVPIARNNPEYNKIAINRRMRRCGCPLPYWG